MSKIDLVRSHAAAGYGSEFDSESESEAKKARRDDLQKARKRPKGTKLPSREEVTEEYSRDENQRQRVHFLTLDAYSRHKKLVNNYLQYYGGSTAELQRDTSKDKRDIDVIKEHHQFLWDEDSDESNSWEKRLAKKYYDKLFKEYCIVDLSRYKENKIALRWRIEKECISGKGQFQCGNKKCSELEGLRSWEVNFAYVEQGDKKNALIKLRLCPDCSYKLNYRHKKREIKARKSRRETASCSATSASDSESVDARHEDVGAKTLTPEEKESSAEKTETEIWSGPVKVDEEKSRDEEFDDYFEDMLL